MEPTSPVGEVYHRIALEHGVDLPAWRLDDAFWRIMRRSPFGPLTGEDYPARCEEETAAWFERIRQTFQATDSTARFEDFPCFASALFDAYRAPGAWRLRDGIPETLDRLRDAACPLCVTSNFDHRLPEILDDLGLVGFFDRVSFPASHGHRKPDRVVFEEAGKAMNRGLDALVYVGDDAPETLVAIADLGIRVLDVRSIENPNELADFILDPTKPAPAATLQPGP